MLKDLKESILNELKSRNLSVMDSMETCFIQEEIPYELLKVFLLEINSPLDASFKQELSDEISKQLELANKNIILELF